MELEKGKEKIKKIMAIWEENQLCPFPFLEISLDVDSKNEIGIKTFIKETAKALGVTGNVLKNMAIKKNTKPKSGTCANLNGELHQVVICLAKIFKFLDDKKIGYEICLLRGSFKLDTQFQFAILKTQKNYSDSISSGKSMNQTSVSIQEENLNLSGEYINEQFLKKFSKACDNEEIQSSYLDGVCRYLSKKFCGKSDVRSNKSNFTENCIINPMKLEIEQYQMKITRLVQTNKELSLKMEKIVSENLCLRAKLSEESNNRKLLEKKLNESGQLIEEYEQKNIEMVKEVSLKMEKIVSENIEIELRLKKMARNLKEEAFSKENLEQKLKEMVKLGEEREMHYETKLSELRAELDSAIHENETLNNNFTKKTNDMINYRKKKY